MVVGEVARVGVVGGRTWRARGTLMEGIDAGWARLVAAAW